MKKFVVLLVLFSIFVLPAFSADISLLLSQAYEQSKQIQQYEKTRQDSLLNSTLSKQKGFSYSLTVSDSTPVFDENGKYIPPSSVSFAYTDSDNKFDFSLSASSSRIVLDQETGLYKLDISAGLSKTFLFRNWDTTDFSDKINSLRIELTYQKSLLNFKKTFINDVISILSLQLSLDKAEKSLIEEQKNYEKALLTGELVENSTGQLKQKLNLESLVTSVSSQKAKYENLLSSFEKNYGFSYYDVNSAKEADFDLEISVQENTELELAELSLKNAQQALNEKKGKESSLKIGLNGGPSMNFSNKNCYESLDINLGASVSWTSGNLNLSAKVQENNENGQWQEPSVFLGGSWSGGKIKSQTEKVEIQRLENAVFTALGNLEDAKFSFSQNLKTLKENIEDLQAELSQLQVQKDYHFQILSYTQTLYEKGYTTASALESAETDCKTDETQELILRLKALSLSVDIQIMNL